MKRSVHIAAALLLSLTLGLHWVVLQSLAWTTMVIQRTQSASFTVALQTTFDGQHPCKLCEVVQAGKSAEKAPDAQLKLPKLEVFSVAIAAPELRFPGRGRVMAAVPAVLKSRLEVPPLPPPRRA